MKPQSLRARLIIIILTPLLLVAVAAAGWQFRNTQARAAGIFDRGLLSAALAISRDVAISDGDALSSITRELVSGTSGGELFYHVYAPDGAFVTGYATPPTPPSGILPEATTPLYYDGTYQGREVRVLRFQDATTIDDVSGLFTISVWQDRQVRAAFVREVASRTVALIGLLLASVALIVWFGVGLGLRPLVDLEEAIAKRSPSELEPIRRDVPAEARGIVATFNSLLDRVQRRISSKDEFISNAAHQMRNPIAGVLALAEAVESAPNPEAAKARSAELVSAARAASHLTNQLLSFERAKGADVAKTARVQDLRPLINSTAKRFQAQATNRRVDVQIELPDAPLMIRADEVMVQEALLNLMTNAVVHGGPDISHIRLGARAQGDMAILELQDDGVGIAKADHPVVMARFAQSDAGPGSGLGLPIAAQVAQTHGGQLQLHPSEVGLRLSIALPLAQEA